MKLKFGMTTSILATLLLSTTSAFGLADMSKWEKEFQPSVLSKSEMKKEMQWFEDAAKPYKGMTIKVVSEGIGTHVYESKTLTKAFYDITGIKVLHDIIGEGDVVEKLQTQMQTGQNIYDAYINDSDFLVRTGDINKLEI
jgi:glycerol transport system substrate-binding protein